jgi:hypothetical protein
MTDVAADPSAEVYADNAMTQQVTTGVTIQPQPAGSSRVAQAAQAKGIMKVRVAGLLPATTYYVRTVTKDQANTDSVAYSPLQTVTTASTVALYAAAQGLANDLMTLPVYVRPVDAAPEPRLGDLVILEAQGGGSPLSAFLGDGATAPEGILDLNNLFGIDGSSLAVAGGERIIIRIYRADNLSTLTHYRRVPQNSGAVSVAGPVKGHFADINLDGSVDTADFSSFKEQYRTLPNDATYNPDYDFVNDPEGSVDVREFGKFSKEFGRTDVH